MDIDFLPPDLTGLGAPLGLMSIPGYQRPLEDDLAELRDQHRCSTLVSLVEDFELSQVASRKLGDIVAMGRGIGLDVVRFPVRDHDVPTDHEALSKVIDDVRAGLARGEPAAIHCFAGLGRTGLFASCCLVAQGFEADRAIVMVRRCRPFAVETALQRDFVHAFERAARARERRG